MKAFADLYEALDSTMSTNAKVDAMVAYFTLASPADAAWAVFFLSGQRMKRLISSRMLAGWFQEATAIPDWLFQECYVAVGDTAETISLLNDTLRESEAHFLRDLPRPHTQLGLANDGHNGEGTTRSIADEPLSVWMGQKIKSLETMDDPARRDTIIGWWRVLDRHQTFILNKLLSGAFRVGVSQRLLLRALSGVSGLEPALLAHRLMGHWEPTSTAYEALIAPHDADSPSFGLDISRPYPFFLAYPLEQPVDCLGAITDWLLEWKWDGIRAQCLARQGQVFFWSRGEELLAGRFPELEEAARHLPEGTVLDGEILAFRDKAPLPFALLQTRIGRKKITQAVMDTAPVVFMAYDILEWEGNDIRTLPLRNRKTLLNTLLLPALQKDQASETTVQDMTTTEKPVLEWAFPSVIMPSLSIEVDSWEAAAALRHESRQRLVEGYILKRLDSTYQSGRKKGDWWKWKIDPLTIDAVLLYAQAGTGRRANLFTDYTFAVWDGDNLVPVAKAYSGLSNEEIEALDKWIRANTKEKFGPVRSVKATHVFELAFEGIAESKRHKSGVALRFPRILRWRHDKPMEEADTLDTLKLLIHAETEAG